MTAQISFLLFLGDYMSQVEHFLIHPAQFKLDGGAMYGIIPKPLWDKKHPADELNRVELALRLWCIKTENKLIVTDTGIGDYHGEKFDIQFDVRGGVHPLKNVLNQAGYQLEDVTDLVISHLHFDHAGGICVEDNGNFIPIFPNANLHLHNRHFDYSLDPFDKDRGSFHHKVYTPAVNYYQEKNKINWLDDEKGTVLSDGDYTLNFVVSHGHTPFLVHPYDDKYIYLADIVPTSNHIHVPWVMAYDIEPARSTEDKKRILEMVAEKTQHIGVLRLVLKTLKKLLQLKDSTQIIQSRKFKKLIA
jgi:glyoxylase-like metal-dependent hydrolase (beta-lactamase superfamily II)